MLTYKDYISYICKTNQFDTSMVTFIIESFLEWIKENLFSCRGVKLNFGRFRVSENKYPGLKSSGLKNKYRASFTFDRTFKHDMSKAKKEVCKETISLFPNDKHNGNLDRYYNEKEE